MAKKRFIIGVDIGGSKIATGLVSPDFKVVQRTEVPTRAHESSEAVLQQVYSSIDTVMANGHCSKSDLIGLGVLAPGPINPMKGFLFDPPNIPVWRNIPLAQIIRDHYDLPTLLENDANAAGLAETLFGAAAGCKYVLYVTVSTGIGTGVIIEGRIYHGNDGLTAEGGHVKINYLGPRCTCGQNGCIEAYASGPSLVRRAKEKLELARNSGARVLALAHGMPAEITPPLIAEAAAEGDSMALELIRETGEFLGIWLGGMVNILDPAMIVIGGGVSRTGHLLFQPIIDTMPKNSINPFANKIPIVPAKFHTDVGILGAAALHMVDGQHQTA